MKTFLTLDDISRRSFLTKVIFDPRTCCVKMTIPSEPPKKAELSIFVNEK